MWTPPKNQAVSSKEVVGRRLFGEDIFNKTDTSRGREGTLRLDQFMEDRAESDLSVDRLGPNKPDSDVLEILLDSCVVQGINRMAKFRGWGVFLVLQATGNPHNFELKATPKDDNKYHADVVVSGLDKRERNKVAFTLSQLSRHIPIEGDETGPQRRAKNGVLLAFLKGLLEKVISKRRPVVGIFRD
jgi:hypothetical protein